MMNAVANMIVACLDRHVAQQAVASVEVDVEIVCCCLILELCVCMNSKVDQRLNSCVYENLSFHVHVILNATSKIIMFQTFY